MVLIPAGIVHREVRCLLLTLKEFFRQWRAFVGNFGFVADQRNRSGKSVFPQFGDRGGTGQTGTQYNYRFFSQESTPLLGRIQ